MPNYKRKACIAAILLCSLITAYFSDCPVVQGAVRKISLDAASKTVLAGKAITFHLKNKPKNAVCKWTANNKNIVSISGNGIIRGKQKGRTVITCTIKTGKSIHRIKASVTVIKPAAKIKIKNPVKELYAGDIYDLNRILLPKDSNDRTTWTSSNTKIAKPDKMGKFKALKAGTVTITAKTLSNKTAKVTITVKEKNDSPVTSPNITNPITPPSTNPGGTLTIPEVDSDQDGLTDKAEQLLGTNPLMADTDGDGLPDRDEVFLFGSDPLCADCDQNGIPDSREDSDQDGLTNLAELNLGTSPILADSDEDGLIDGDEVNRYHTNPLKEDTDRDGLIDGDEVLLGLNPLQADSDQNGVPDSREKINQTFTVSIEEEQKPEVTRVSVNLNAAGYLNRTTVIDSVYGLDILSSNVAGLIGAPVEITTEASFDEAVITFSYDETRLNGTSEEDLSILWYDEANSQYILMEDSNADAVNNTVSCTTSHFSTYMLVDRSIWYNTWRQLLLKYNSRSEHNNLIIYMEASVNMEEAAYRNQEAAIKKIADAMAADDRAFLFSSGSYIEGSSLKPLTGQDLKTLVEKETRSLLLDPGRIADQNMYDTMKDSIQNIGRINLLTDNKISQLLIFSSGVIAPMYSYVEQDLVDQINLWGVRLHTVKIADNEDNGFLAYLAGIRDNHGSFQNVTNIDALDTDVYFPKPDWRDTDGDGIYDIYETEGMVIPNGTCVYTDPYKADSDGDGLPDADEMGIPFRFNPPLIGTSIPLTVYSIQANPYERDSDSDGIPDRDDANPNKAFCKKKKGSVETFKEFPKYIVQEYKPDELRSVNIDTKLKEQQALFGSEVEMYAKNGKKFRQYINNAYLTINLGYHLFLPTATEFLEHYMNKSGTQKNIYIINYIRKGSGYKYFKDNVNNLITACENGVKNGATVNIATNPNVKFPGTKYDDSYWNILAHANKYLAVNCSDALMHCTCTNDNDKYSITMTYYITDVYDWDKNNNARIGYTTSQELYFLKLIGIALDFEVRGYTTFSFEWEKGERIGKELSLSLLN